MRVIKLLATLALTGCALAGVAILAMAVEPTTPTTGPDSTPAQSGALTADQYHGLIRIHVPSFANRDDENLDQIAAGVCTVFRTGGTWERVITSMLDAGTPGSDAGKATRFAVARECPEQAGKLPGG